MQDSIVLYKLYFRSSRLNILTRENKLAIEIVKLYILVTDGIIFAFIIQNTEMQLRIP